MSMAVGMTCDTAADPGAPKCMAVEAVDESDYMPSAEEGLSVFVMAVVSEGEGPLSITSLPCIMVENSV